MSRRPAAAKPLPLMAWAEQKRRRELAHRRRVRRWSVALAPLIAALAISIASPLTPWLVWNASASAPIGLYAVAPGTAPQRGDMVIARVPVGVRVLAVSRRYIPINVPLVKHVGAIAGDIVCAIGPRITINRTVTVVRRAVDGAKRPMPWWYGCRRVGSEEVFLLSADAPASFDGRYFGISSRRDIVGMARPLWVR